eukprot:gene7542-9346_t
MRVSARLAGGGPEFSPPPLRGGAGPVGRGSAFGGGGGAGGPPARRGGAGGEVFGVPTSQVSREQRRYAKVINFGLIYGMSAFGLAKALSIDNTAAKNYITRYFERFAGVKQYMDDTREQAKVQGYVETVFGRRLVLPDIQN